MVSGIGRNINRCCQCGATNDDGGEWFWTDEDCTKCSVCFPASGLVINGGRYRKPPIDDPSKSAYYERTKQRASMRSDEWRDTPQEPIRLDLPKSDPYGLLLLTLVENAVDSIRSYIRRRSLSKQLENYAFNAMLDNAQMADRWLRGSACNRIPFAWVCMFHDLDQQRFQAQIYSQFDESELERMRSAKFRNERIRIQTVGLSNEERL